MAIALLNTSIITSDGVFVYTTIDLTTAIQLVERAGGIDSYIGHDATAQILAELFGFPVEVSRRDFQQEPGDSAIVFKLAKRITVPRELNRDDVEKVGYTLGLLARVDKQYIGTSPPNTKIVMDCPGDLGPGHPVIREADGGCVKKARKPRTRKS